MGNFLAIGGVSATLQALLRDRMELPAGMVRTDLLVTVSTPQPEDDTQATEPTRVNLFLYRATENGALKNQMIPGQGHPGEYGHPPLSLVLHYMLTAYGATDDAGQVNETRAHFLLGSAMRVLHDYPVITDSLTTINSPPTQILHSSLRGEFEHIKICLDPISLEDLSKVWTALTRPYRLSAAYTVSVVQIESRRIKTLAAPVLTRRIHLAVSKRPQIANVYRTPVLPGEPIGDIRAHVLQELTIEGENFRAAQTWVKLGDLELIGVQPASDREIRIVVPDDMYPADADHPLPRPIPAADQLRPGPQTVEVQILQPTEVVEGGLDRGVVGVDDRRQSSNHCVFLLAPEISRINPSSVAAGGFAGALLTVTGRRLFQSGMKTVVLVGDVSIPVQDPGPGGPQTDTSIQVSLIALGLTTPPTPAGLYPVRVMVNSVQSMENVTFQVT
jgi:Pvc16 N-terminal domain/IPT/TIG domain